MVPGPVWLGIVEPANALGAGGYGPVHAPYHRIWHSPRNGRWAVTVLDVPASHSRAMVAEVSQHGQRSCVSVPPMAGQPASVGSGGNQDRTLCAAIASLCGATGWNPQERVLDRSLFWTTADLAAKLREFQEYFNKHRTHAGLKTTPARSWRTRVTDKLYFVWLAEALSRVVPDADCRVIL